MHFFLSFSVFNASLSYHKSLLTEVPPLREQENMALKLLGTREQKENKAGNKGTKAVLRKQGTTKLKKMILGNKGTQGI